MCIPHVSITDSQSHVWSWIQKLYFKKGWNKQYFKRCFPIYLSLNMLLAFLSVLIDSRVGFPFKSQAEQPAWVIRLFFELLPISIISLILSLIKNGQQQNYFAILHVNHPGLLIAAVTNITLLQYTVMFLLNLLNLKTKKLRHCFAKTNRSLCWDFLSSLWYYLL